MALQTKTISDTGSKGHHKFSLKVTENSTSVSDNTSSVSFEFTMKDVQSGWDWYYSTAPVTWSLSIAGKSYSGGIKEYDGSGTITLKSDTITVAHNSDGTKSISYSFSVSSKDISYLPGSADDSGSMTLTAIPRASSLSLNVSSVNVGGSITASISRKTSSYVHDVRFYINDTYTSETYKNVATSQSFEIPESWYNYMSSSMSCTAYCKIITRKSSSDTTQIGDPVTKSFTVTVPSSVKPKIGTIHFAPENITIDGKSYNYLVQKQNNLTIYIKNCSAGTGSKIKSYTISGPNASRTVTTTSPEITYLEPAISASGTLTYTITITDTRGQTATKTADVYCYPYFKPTISSIPYRGDSEGVKKNNGTYLYCPYNALFASVDGKNKISIDVYGIPESPVRIVSDSTETSGTANTSLNDVDNTYNVYVKITDSFGNTSTSSVTTLFGSSRVMNVSPDGTAVAFGKKVDKDESECLESRYKIWARGGIYLSNSVRKYPALMSATDDLWIGASGKEGTHNEEGGTYISSGAHNNIYASKLSDDNVRTNYTIFDAENYTEYVDPKPVVLCELTTATDGNVTLSDDADNYKYIEIFYRNNSTLGEHYVRDSVKIAMPHDSTAATVVLTVTEPDVANARIKIKTAYYVISGTTMTKKDSVYASIKAGTTSIYTDKVEEGLYTKNQILVYKVLGYK